MHEVADRFVDDVVAVAEHVRLARPPAREYFAPLPAANRLLVRLALGELRRVVDDRQQNDDGRRRTRSSKTALDVV